MDAVTAKAFEALTRQALPQLLQILAELEEIPAAEREASADCQRWLLECVELLQLLKPWAGLDEAVPSEVSEAEAMAAMSEMDGPAEMSDAEAKAALAAMDDPAEMSEAEAMVAMSEMDGPAEMSDDEAKAALAAMDGGSSEEMSDDEAKAALAAMDGGSSEEMSDDEAKAALAAMEGSPTEPSGEASGSEDLAKANEEVEEIEEFGGSEFQSDPDMMKDFINNTDELIENLDEQILNLERAPEDREVINEIFRSAHTLKGGAGMFGFKAMERIMHRMENYFDQLSKGKRTARSQGIDLMLSGLDAIKQLMVGVRAGSPVGLKTAPIVRQLNQLCYGKDDGAIEAAPAVSSSAPQQEPAAAAEAPKAGAKDAAAGQSTIRVDLHRLDTLVNLIGELVIDRTRFSSIESQIRSREPSSQLSTNMTETVQLFGRHMNEIQDIIMKVRMVPIGNAFNKFSRIVRELAKKLDKKIDLVITGQQTELDKTIVEQIGDPLIHLIRNAIDHGIESPEERIAQGKNPEGVVHLSASQEGNQIVIKIKDDGKGMDKEKIRAKGIERGLITEEDYLSDRDIFNLIFEPGFSTADQVTNISGRGVGMDVVGKQIAKLKGVIEIQSEAGKGSTFSLQLPLTLAIVQSLLVNSVEETLAIPLSSVVESIRIKPQQIQSIGNVEVIKRRNQILPLLYLEEVLCLCQKREKLWYNLNEVSDSESDKSKDQKLFVVVVGSAERRFGIVVNSLLNQQEMVIKSMGSLVYEIPCIAGGAILGNGEVVLVLEISELSQQFSQLKRAVGNG